MTDRPYTRNDLLAEAARQHHALTQDPDRMGVGEAMDTIPSTGSSWEEALVGENDDWGAFDAAMDAIHTLITRAADTSGWAITLGADGLVPHAHALDLGPGDQPPRVRIHFAFAADMAERDRADLIAQIAAFTITDLT